MPGFLSSFRLANIPSGATWGSQSDKSPMVTGFASFPSAHPAPLRCFGLGQIRPQG